MSGVRNSKINLPEGTSHIELAPLGQDLYDTDKNFTASSTMTIGCTVASEKVGNTSSGAATESDDEVCTECNYVITPALGEIHT